MTQTPTLFFRQHSFMQELWRNRKNYQHKRKHMSKKRAIRLGKYPYIQNTGKLRKFLEKIPVMGDPKKITQPSLPQIGFGSPNDRPIVPILRFIGFLNDNNETTQEYRDFRVFSKSKTVMRLALKRAYQDLFQLYPNASEVDDKSLQDFFKQTTDAGEQVVGQTVATFKTLCGFAEFKGVSEQMESPEVEQEKTVKKERATITTTQGLTINLNIQLTLPVTENEKVYENIFKALRNNLLSPEPRAD